MAHPSGGAGGDPALASDPTLVYHERQQSALCGVHAVNALLQGPYHSEVGLADIAHELDASERALMLANGAETREALEYLAQESFNVDDSGNFSISVLRTAIERSHGVALEADPKMVAGALANPNRFEAYMFNLQAHWFAIRRLPTRAGARWFNLDSMLDRPELISEFFLAAFLHQMQAEGYNIFVVTGALPVPMRDGSAGGAGALHSVADIVRFAGKGKAEKASLQKAAAAKAQSLAASDPEYEAALRASMAASRGRGDFAEADTWTSGGGGDSGGRIGAMELAGMDFDEQLQAAMQASVATAFGGGGGGGGAGVRTDMPGRVGTMGSAGMARHGSNVDMVDATAGGGDADEEAQLRAAIALSMGSGSEGSGAATSKRNMTGSGAAAGAGGSSLLQAASAPPAELPTQTIARLQALLPAEPAAAEPYTRIQVRLPPTAPAAGMVAGGQTPSVLQKQRRFRPTDTLADLLRWVEVAWLEAHTQPVAAAGVLPLQSPRRPLAVAPYQLVASAVHRTFVPGTGEEQTLADAGLVPSASVILRAV
jgi:ataxin-3